MRAPATVALIGGLACAGPSMAQNRQPISTSLAECSVIMSELATIAVDRGRDWSTVDRADEAAGRFYAAAIDHARSEGVGDPEAHVALLCRPLNEKWRGRFSSVWKFRDNRDWLDYCAALGRDRGIYPIPGGSEAN